MVVAAILLALPSAGSGQVRLLGLDDRVVDPFQVPSGVRAIAFVFTSVECPISNRYAPEIRRLHDRFSSKGVLFRLVFPNPADRPPAIREHLKAFAYPAGALRDPRHDLVRLAKAAVTPEAAVFGLDGKIVYRGRIDDRYADLGVDRQVPTRRDLEDALAAAVDDKPVPHPVTRAVGCVIADLGR